MGGIRVSLGPERGNRTIVLRNASLEKVLEFNGAFSNQCNANRIILGIYAVRAFLNPKILIFRSRYLYMTNTYS